MYGLYGGVKIFLWGIGMGTMGNWGMGIVYCKSGQFIPYKSCTLATALSSVEHIMLYDVEM